MQPCTRPRNLSLYIDYTMTNSPINTPSLDNGECLLLSTRPNFDKGYRCYLTWASRITYEETFGTEVVACYMQQHWS